MQLQTLVLTLFFGVCAPSSSLHALQSRRREPAVIAAPISSIQPQALCAFSLQERHLQLQGGAALQVEEVVCAQRRPRLRLRRWSPAGDAGPLPLVCLQALVRVGEHVVRSACVLAQDELHAAGNPRPNVAI
ncbi:hypothetical protein R5R35_000970 [Gryllus longicercus]|uniref:Accessory gland protein n=1 Tax=Gryllus longicercus TaxID=2509291 RepID=A0AAN9YXN2_9ORTH